MRECSRPIVMTVRFIVLSRDDTMSWMCWNVSPWERKRQNACYLYSSAEPAASKWSKIFSLCRPIKTQTHRMTLEFLTSAFPVYTLQILDELQKRSVWYDELMLVESCNDIMWNVWFWFSYRSGTYSWKILVLRVAPSNTILRKFLDMWVFPLIVIENSLVRKRSFRKHLNP